MVRASHLPQRIAQMDESTTHAPHSSGRHQWGLYKAACGEWVRKPQLVRYEVECPRCLRATGTDTGEKP